MEVSPNHPFVDGFSMKSTSINHLFWGTPFMENLKCQRWSHLALPLPSAWPETQQSQQLFCSIELGICKEHATISSESVSSSWCLETWDIYGYLRVLGSLASHRSLAREISHSSIELERFAMQPEPLVLKVGLMWISNDLRGHFCCNIMANPP